MDHRAVRAEVGRQHYSGMAGQGENQFAGVGIPDSGRVVFGRGDDTTTIPRK